MKFECEEEQDRSECVAFIHKSGCLIVKHDDATYDNYCQVLGSGSDTKRWWDAWMKDATRKFYPGDKITITF
jgi:hypothetical protein